MLDDIPHDDLDATADTITKIIHETALLVASQHQGEKPDNLSTRQSNMDGHESSTETNFFLSHLRLEFPCVWATIIHGTGVPAPPHVRLPP